MKVEDSINDIIKNVEKLSNHLNAYKTYHDKLGNTLGTAVNHYNDSTKEFKKIDKDIIRISGTSKLDINSELIEKPQSDNQFILLGKIEVILPNENLNKYPKNKSPAIEQPKNGIAIV